MVKSTTTYREFTAAKSGDAPPSTRARILSCPYSLRICTCEVRIATQLVAHVTCDWRRTWGQGSGSSHGRLEGQAVLSIFKHISGHLQLEHEVSERIAGGDGGGLEGVPRKRSQQP